MKILRNWLMILELEKFWWVVAGFNTITNGLASDLFLY
jgi:hypothetical protein